MTNTSSHLENSVFKRLRQQRQAVLKLSGEKAMARILNCETPPAVVHSLAVEDFYILVHDIGITDAHPILSLASDRQRDYLMDKDGWLRDRMQYPVVTRYLDAMLTADPKRLITWLKNDQLELLESYLYQNIQIVIRQHDEDPSSFGPNFFTHDDLYYIRVIDDPIPLDSSVLDKEGTPNNEQRHLFIQKLLATLAAHDHIAYQKLLLETMQVLPAEMEEEAYRLRNVRLAERGFAPFHEAIGIYQTVDIGRLRKSTKSYGKPSDDVGLESSPSYPIQMLQSGDTFVDTLARIEDTVLSQQLQSEFAALCNRIISADQKTIQARSELKTVVQKACGYLNIGIERYADLTGLASRQKTTLMTGLLENAPLSDIFRFGYGQALDLKFRAQRWQKAAWFVKNRLPMTFWGEVWVGVLGGLLLTKPLYYDNYASGDSLFREFKSSADITHSERVLDEMIDFDAILSDMEVDIALEESSDGHHLTYKSLVLTLWANETGLNQADQRPKPSIEPIPLDSFKRFFIDLLDESDFDGDRKSPKTVSQSVKTGFLNWLSQRTGKQPEMISNRLGPCLTRLFDEVESELGQVSADNLDPRYVQLFWVA